MQGQLLDTWKQVITDSPIPLIEKYCNNTYREKVLAVCSRHTNVS